MQIKPVTNVQQDIDTLSNYEAFARFMSLILTMREECIEELHLANSDNIQQISGRLLSYDQILHMVDYDSLIEKHRN
mgnify:CR=1 FL=1|jgi:hypothetical protein|tara:strand:- start:135 stop:365 length:231 start_codon:yes stop_codon:yes gene_type:complete